MSSSGNGEMDGAEAARQRRRRINEAFRSGDLRVCLREVAAGLREDPSDATMTKALGVVQTRFMAEVVEPAAAESRWEDVAQALSELGATSLPAEMERRVAELQEKIRKSRTPPEHALDVREKTLRKAEEAWAAGKRREARDLLRSLDGLPMDDHDLTLRREGLARLMEQDVIAAPRDGIQPHTAGRWVVLLVVAAVAVVALLALRGVIFPSAPPEAPSAPPVAVETAPAEGYVAFAVTPQDAAVRDLDGVLGTAAEVVTLPHGLHSITVTAPGYHDTTVAVTVTAAETLTVAVELRPAEPAEGSLALRSSPPGALVLLGGVTSLGVTPLEATLEPGTHRLLVSADGRVSEWVQVRIRPGETTDTSVTLSPRYPYGQLQINAVPWAFVFINGDSLGPTPLTTGNLATGVEHECVFRRPDGSLIRQRVRLDPKRGTPTPLTVGEAKPALLAVAVRDSTSGRPSWVNVWIGSRLLGTAPGEFEVPSGEVTVRLEREGYETVVRELELTQGQRTELSVALKPAQ